MKRVAQLLAVSFISLILTAILVLGIIEVILKLTIRPSTGGSIFEYTMSTKRYKVYKKNHRIVAWGVDFQTNALGFRDNKSVVPFKRPGEFRIVVLGDSFTASAGVQYERIYTSLLERELRRKFENATVLNLAVGGYNIIQYSIVLDEVGMGLQPDMVVVATFPYNDLKNDDYDRNYLSALGLMQSGTPTPWYHNLYIYQAYIYRIERQVRSLLIHPGKIEKQDMKTMERKREHDKKTNLEALNKIKDTCISKGVEPIVVLLPNTSDFGAQREEFRGITDYCELMGIRYRSLLDSFIASGVRPDSLRLNVVDVHPNPRYHELVTEQLAPVLMNIIQARY